MNSAQLYLENKRKNRRELDVSSGTPAEAADKGGGERERTSRRSFALVRGQRSQRRPHPDEEDGQQRSAKHRRDSSAPPSYETSRDQRNDPGASATSSQDEIIGKNYDQDSFAARLQQPGELSTKFNIISVTTSTVTGNDGEPLARYQSTESSVAASGSPGAQADKMSLSPSPAPESEAPAITAAIVQHATAPSTSDGSSDKGLESRPQITNSMNIVTSNSNGHPNTPSNLEDFNSICQELYALIDTQEKEIAKLKDSRMLLQQQNTDLQQQHRDIKEQNLNLHQDLAQLEDENNELEKRAEDLQDLLASKATSTTNPGASLIGDTQVQGRWKSLCFEIRQCVTEYVKTNGNLAAIHKSVFSGPHSPTLDHEAMFVRDTEGCRLLAQAVIWRILVEYVFGNRTRMSRMFWAGKFSENVRCVADAAFATCDGQTDLKAFHGWRRQTATFLSAVAAPEDVESYTESVLAVTQDKLKCFLPMSWPASLRGRVKEIITSAIRIDCDLSQQWAYWYVDYPNQPDRHGSQSFQRFNGTLMKGTKSHDAGQPVALMISPALFKAGDSRGQGYLEQVELHCKCEVICDEDPDSHPRPLEWQDWQMPQSVPLVADHKTEKLRKQRKQTSTSSDITGKVLGLMGIKKTG